MPTKRKNNKKYRKKTAKNRRLGGTKILLDLSDKDLETMDEIQEGIKILYRNYNQLTNLPTLPNSLEELYCSNNQLKTLPVLPPNLKHISCGNNKLKLLPKLPTNLKILNCENNLLETIPELPSTLLKFVCSKNQLKTLPVLPPNLKYISCGNNKLKLLPKLPTNLIILNCGNNLLETIPELPSTLSHLFCYNNPLKSFPNFPNNLEYLSISINQVLLLNIENISSEIRSIKISDEDEYINYAVDEPTKIIEKIDTLKSKFGDRVSLTIPKFNKLKEEFKIELEKITEEMSQHKQLYPKQSTTFPKDVSKEIMSYVAKGGKRKTVKKLNIYL
jgi:hypothetical protein